MRIRLCLISFALGVAPGARAQSDIEIGDLDPPALDGLRGAMGCVAYHLEDSCSYVLGYVQDGPEKVILLKEFQRRLPSGRAEWLIIDVVKVPPEFSGRLESNDCRYDGDMMQPIIAAMSATGSPGDWVGPADWVVIVDWEQNQIVSGDPQLVECWQNPEGGTVAPNE
jgi:hypothetical protein